MPTKAEVFTYLEALRKSGVTNMLGATPYLQKHFSMTDLEATDWLLKWIYSFEEDENANQ